MATRAVWAKRIARWERSGLPRAVFAKREGLKAASLSWWRWELARDKAAPVTALARPLSFVELGVAAPPAPEVGRIEVGLPNGRVVLVPHGFDEQTLRRVLDAADRR